MIAPPPPLDTPTARTLAVKAHVDPRTILAIARGDKVRGDAGHRARAALTEAGYVIPDKARGAIGPQR
jgi:hypothetical protein